MSEELKKECMKEEYLELGGDESTIPKDVDQETLQKLVESAREAYCASLGPVRCRPYIPAGWEHRMNKKLKTSDV
jgi:hypothetical protein